MDDPFPLVIRLPGEPRGKGRPQFGQRVTKDSRKITVAITPKRTRSYEGMLAHMASLVMKAREPVEGALHVVVLATFSVPASWSKKKQRAALAGELAHVSKPDVDNLGKVLDALNKIVWRDDAQIGALTIVKRYGAIPELRVTVRRPPAIQQEEPKQLEIAA